MTADDYLVGYNYKMNKCKLANNKTFIALAILVLLCANVVLFFMNAHFVNYIITNAIIIFLLLITFNSRKNTIKKQFLSSVILNDTHTIRIYDEGLEFINSYEKIFAPWQSIFSVKMTEKYLFILPTYRKGLFVIDKQKYAGEELNALIETLQTKTSVEEGKK